MFVVPIFQQYSMAAGILEHLFKRIEPVDEWAAMRLAFLLLDVYIVAYRGCVADDQVRVSICVTATHTPFVELFQPYIALLVPESL